MSIRRTFLFANRVNHPRLHPAHSQSTPTAHSKLLTDPAPLSQIDLREFRTVPWAHPISRSSDSIPGFAAFQRDSVFSLLFNAEPKLQNSKQKHDNPNLLAFAQVAESAVDVILHISRWV